MHIYKITYSLLGTTCWFQVFAENEEAAAAILEREHAGATLIMLEEVA